MRVSSIQPEIKYDKTKDEMSDCCRGGDLIL